MNRSCLIRSCHQRKRRSHQRCHPCLMNHSYLSHRIHLMSCHSRWNRNCLIHCSLLMNLHSHQYYCPYDSSRSCWSRHNHWTTHRSRWSHQSYHQTSHIRSADCSSHWTIRNHQIGDPGGYCRENQGSACQVLVQLTKLEIKVFKSTRTFSTSQIVEHIHVEE